MDFFDELGSAGLGSRLRRLSEVVTSQAAEVYELYHVAFEPRWFPVFYVVATEPGRHVGDIAERIGQTHAAVSQVVKDLVKHELVQVQRGETDQRRSVISLTEKGAALWPALQQQTADVRQATETLLAETRHNLWLAIGEMEYALSRQSLGSRVKAIRDARVGSAVRIREYEPQFQPDFKRLNIEWIERYFRVEEPDLKALDHPEEYILQPGGRILLAEYQGQIVGACALLRMDADTVELAKMAVSPAAQGLGIGFRLGEAAIAQARALGSKRLYLESNTKLAPAIQLYHKLGFRKTVAGQPSPYERCNIQMELVLQEVKG
ncbi:DNA-binding MarR family transcriptional regulator/predicted GNAT family N-acyltransferase [Hymenobacter luteus]|uniref:DNA-binding MarR family transcriptional regulator/predicted GNAT family N-acyltransferase n=2 Tax=Hymenobacter TaxID=89966 RepID=A0A7W9T2Y5_9BACT|nr:MULTISPECIES: bifunctional helix-turn-helix transcriptional regulator/GNAT family N-acetyltransferase [Hymenobacter]MBB4601542.1 DNA-binding MarR family transcriptional regulator/predicted GNAT family N-acyltransferase [Hymenobacter latericoloratus]MBB6060030.1 DNA-binding MarR family transcriptional regulator/predicted GNAT family N-acyltransferase [Hymenobacter luteus]